MSETLSVTTPTDREILITRSFRAPRQLVFECLIQPERVQRWLLGPEGWSMPVCDIDFRVGGRFRYVWQHKDGRRMGMGGEYREIERPARIVHTELFDDDWTQGETVVTSRLTEADGRTTLAITVLYSSMQARDGARRSGMERGMAVGFDRLAAILAEG